jgi:flagellar L-ring protein FlgH
LKRLVLLALPIALAGCGTMDDLGVEPRMTPIGSTLPTSTLAAEPATYRDYNSLYVHGNDNLFTDSRAAKVGDVVTVIIEMNEKAELDNSSERSRTSRAGLSSDWGWGTSSGTPKSGNFGAGVNSTSGSSGDGTIERSEKIKLSVAAVVTKVLPNGNLVISGSQEVRVNFEMRVLNVAGIVRPRDINGQNTVAYEKVAEARISYGGRGRLTEVQQPGVVHQLYDRIAPF